MTERPTHLVPRPTAAAAVRRARRWLCSAATLVVALCAAAAAHAGPAVGEKAPAFSLPGSDGRTYTLEGLLAEHGGVVLAWFPKAFTPG